MIVFLTKITEYQTLEKTEEASKNKRTKYTERIQAKHRELSNEQHRPTKIWG